MTGMDAPSTQIGSDRNIKEGTSSNPLIEIERYLLKTEEGPEGVSCTIQLDIDDVGSWLIKFRPFGVLVNNRDNVIADCITPDASITFTNCSVFWTIASGTSSFIEEVAQKRIHHYGSLDSVELFKVNVIRSSDISLISMKNAEIIHQRSPVDVQLTPDETEDIVGTERVGDKLKGGWLLKKRDMLAGWKSRYFVVYIGRVEYFTDNQAGARMRGVISLSGAEVHPAKRIQLHGQGEHWGITVETKNKEKTFRLASELRGMEGMVEMKTWEKVFAVASTHPSLQKLDSPSFRKAASLGASALGAIAAAAGAKAASPKGGDSGAAAQAVPWTIDEWKRAFGLLLSVSSILVAVAAVLLYYLLLR